jgi:mannitol/fructose-specific phosphotransferase system IIA component
MYTDQVVPSFYISPKNYDYTIIISVNGKDSNEKIKILQSIFLDLGEEYKVEALQPECNIKTFQQIFLLKKKNK